MSFRHALEVGTRLGKFEIIGVLGAGGFGLTYLCRDPDLSLLRVVKEFYPTHLVERDESRRVTVRNSGEEASFASGLRSFLREAQIAASLSHQNICKVMLYFEANGTGYFAMDYAEGETLATRLTRSPAPLSFEEIVETVAPVLDALEYIHQRGLVHRDVKPANIFLRSIGGPLLIDFGAARQATQGSIPLTAILTRGYAPPEQYGEGTAQGPFTDIYSIGAVLYRLASGRDPIDAFSRYANAAADPLVPIEVAARADYPPELGAVVGRCLRLQPAERFQSISELKSTLLRTALGAAGRRNGIDAALVAGILDRSPAAASPEATPPPALEPTRVDAIVADRREPPATSPRSPHPPIDAGTVPGQTSPSAEVVRHFVGIDLGTTNSAICMYDGVAVRLLKSPEQHDVTPSAIYFDKRGNKYVGARAYNNASRNPDNSALLFKRLMGTNTPLRLSVVDKALTPEDCSAEVLRVLFAYLPEDIRRSQATGTVITVPAAFNQMQKDATMAAAAAAGIGKVALMQEPVAAVMSVMRHRSDDGIFVVLDLGGGTLDVAIAESLAGRVSLLAHGGVEMCGGRDFDRLLFDQVLRPWLMRKFNLPDDLMSDPRFKTLMRLATFAAERAKIELSQKSETVVSMPENELGVRDLDGEEMYLDVPLTRAEFDALIGPKLDEAIEATRRTLEKAGISEADVSQVVFVGGPTQYKPLRDRISSALSIKPSTDVNPMTAVAEGAAVFAESIDWDSMSRGRKSSRGELSAATSLAISFAFVARTPDARARIVVNVGKELGTGYEFQLDSLASGWSSGRMPLRGGASADVLLSKPGENVFKVFVFDPSGSPVALEQDRLVFTRTAASIDAIPASHSVGVEARDKLGGKSILDYLVKDGDQLPKRGRKVFKAAETLRAGSSASLKFKLWEGSITDPVTDNRFIGMFEIRGTDFDDGVIVAGADLHCDFEVLDSGNVVLEVSVPSIGGAFHSGKNFYSRQEGQIDYSNAARLIREQAQRAMERLYEIADKVDDVRVDATRGLLEAANGISETESDPESAKQAMDRVHEARRMLAQIRKDNLKAIRQMDLTSTRDFFDSRVRQHARPSDELAFDNLVKTAQRAIDNGSPDFESHLDELRGRNFSVLWRQDWFVIDRFDWLATDVHLFPDSAKHADVVAQGRVAMDSGRIDSLRGVVAQLDSMRVSTVADDQMLASSNIVRG